MRILILEDEPRTARLLKEFIQAYNSEFEIVGILDSLESTLHFLDEMPKIPDLIFMDIQLSDGNSFDLFKKKSLPAPVVFCTAFEEYTLQAFQTVGIDYILKPFLQEDISKALQKADNLKQLFVKQNQPLDSLPINQKESASFFRYFLVNYRDKMYPVNINSIAIFFLEDEKLFFVNFKNERFPLQKKMEELEKGLDPGQFFRINRQMILHREGIENIEFYFNRKLFVKLKIQSPVLPIVSRMKVSRFTHWIENG